MWVNSLCPYWKSKEWAPYWIKDIGNKYIAATVFSFISSFVQINSEWIWIWISWVNIVWASIDSVWRSPMSDLPLTPCWWLDYPVLFLLFAEGIACQVVSWQQGQSIMTEHCFGFPINAVFLTFPGGWTDLITERSCILDCAVKYTCHDMSSDGEWWYLCFCTHYIDSPLLKVRTDLVHRWNIGAPEGRTKCY